MADAISKLVIYRQMAHKYIFEIIVLLKLLGRSGCAVNSLGLIRLYIVSMGLNPRESTDVCRIFPLLAPLCGGRGLLTG